MSVCCWGDLEQCSRSCGVALVPRRVSRCVLRMSSVNEAEEEVEVNLCVSRQRSVESVLLEHALVRHELCHFLHTTESRRSLHEVDATSVPLRFTVVHTAICVNIVVRERWGLLLDRQVGTSTSELYCRDRGASGTRRLEILSLTTPCNSSSWRSTASSQTIHISSARRQSNRDRRNSTMFVRSSASKQASSHTAAIVREDFALMPATRASRVQLAHLHSQSFTFVLLRARVGTARLKARSLSFTLTLASAQAHLAPRTLTEVSALRSFLHLRATADYKSDHVTPLSHLLQPRTLATCSRPSDSFWMCECAFECVSV